MRKISRFLAGVLLIQEIQSFVAEGKFKQADELVKKSLAENYNDPQMLSLSALVAVAMQDWVQAIARLHVVIKIQGNDTPPLPHLLLIRSYRIVLDINAKRSISE